MKKMIIFMSVILLLFSTCKTKAATDKKEIEAKIKLVADYLLSQEGPGEDAKEGFKLLVEVIEMASADTGFPSDFGEKISEARRLFESNSIFDQQGISLLEESYMLINDGKTFQIPDSISSIQQAVEHARQLIGSSQQNLKKGEIDECTRDLLEVALMVVTPMTQEIR